MAQQADGGARGAPPASPKLLGWSWMTFEWDPYAKAPKGQFFQHSFSRIFYDVLAASVAKSCEKEAVIKWAASAASPKSKIQESRGASGRRLGMQTAGDG